MILIAELYCICMMKLMGKIFNRIIFLFTKRLNKSSIFKCRILGNLISTCLFPCCSWIRWLWISASTTSLCIRVPVCTWPDRGPGGWYCTQTSEARVCNTSFPSQPLLSKYYDINNCRTNTLILSTLLML